MGMRTPWRNFLPKTSGRTNWRSFARVTMRTRKEAKCLTVSALTRVSAVPQSGRSADSILAGVPFSAGQPQTAGEGDQQRESRCALAKTRTITATWKRAVFAARPCSPGSIQKRRKF